MSFRAGWLTAVVSWAASDLKKEESIIVQLAIFAMFTELGGGRDWDLPLPATSMAEC